MRPLEGIRALDTTQYVAGPYCAMLLGDLGAEVIKIERPGVGDIYRQQGPEFINGESVTFLSFNRNKKSLTLNLKHPRAQEIVARLIPELDVFLENFTPGTVERLGLGYDSLRQINPRLIYCSISGYGQTGPYRDKGGYDLMLQGLGGLMSVTGEADGAPVKVGVPVLDMGAALYAVCGILGAYIVRQKTGRGQHVDTSLLECCAAFLTLLAGKYFATGEVPGRMGSASPMFAPYQAFKTRDIHITVVGTGGKDHWQRFCRALDLKHLIDDPRFATNADRVRNLKELAATIEERLQTKSGYHWLERLEEEGLPCGPINTFDRVVEDPQIQARQMVIEVEHPVAGLVKMMGIPIKFSETPGGVDSPPPALGQHNEEILGSLGYSEAEIADLREEGVI